MLKTIKSSDHLADAISQESLKPVASHYINGAYVEDASGQVIEQFYPATGESIAQIHAATPAIVEQALDAAQQAQAEWAAMSGMQRGRILRRAADLMRERNEALSILETCDTGKPLSETRVADASSGADALEYFAGMAASLKGEHIQLGDDWVYTRREPLGVCVGIGAWNYPTQIACWKLAPALACGNSMIFKPSEMTPFGALKVAEILTEAGLPAGVFNVVQGYGDIGQALIADSRTAKVSLTGSVETGRKVYAQAAEAIKQVTMELGGKSPLIIFDDASLEDAVGGAILGNFYSSGQICSNGTRIFVQRNIHDAFLARLMERMQGIDMSDPLSTACNYGPMISEAQLNRVLHYIDLGVAEGAQLVCGGKRIDRPGFWLQPTVFDNVRDNMTIAIEEIFGPVMCVFVFDEEDEVIKRSNDSDFGLAGGVFTRDISRAHRVVSRLDVGTCYINSYNDAPVEAPFGGSKQSGVGRENSHAAIEHYTQLKSVYVRMGSVESPY